MIEAEEAPVDVMPEAITDRDANTQHIRGEDYRRAIFGSPIPDRQKFLAHIIAPKVLFDQFDNEAIPATLLLERFNRVVRTLEGLFPQGLYELIQKFHEMGLDSFLAPAEGCPVFLDLTGSTHMAELLISKLGQRRGTEMITTIYNKKIYPSADKALVDMGANKLSVQGDALVLSFMGEDYEKRAFAFTVEANRQLAIVAEEIKEMLLKEGLTKEEVDSIELRYRTGISVGAVDLANFTYGLGDDKGSVLYPVGVEFAEAEKISNIAGAGQIVITEGVKAALLSDYPDVQMVPQAGEQGLYVVDFDQVQNLNDTYVQARQGKGLDIAGNAFATTQDSNGSSSSATEVEPIEIVLQMLAKAEVLGRYLSMDDLKHIVGRVAEGEPIEANMTKRPMIFMEFKGICAVAERMIASAYRQTSNESQALKNANVAWQEVCKQVADVLDIVASHNGDVEKFNVHGMGTVFMLFLRSSHRSPEQTVKTVMEIRELMKARGPFEVYVAGEKIEYRLELLGAGIGYGPTITASIGGRWTMIGREPNLAARAMTIAVNGDVFTFGDPPIIMTESFLGIIDTTQMRHSDFGVVPVKGNENFNPSEVINLNIDDIRHIPLIGAEKETASFETFVDQYMAYHTAVAEDQIALESHVLVIQGDDIGGGSLAYANRYEYLLEEAGLYVLRGQCLPRSSLHLVSDLCTQAIDIIVDSGYWGADLGEQMKTNISETTDIQTLYAFLSRYLQVLHKEIDPQHRKPIALMMENLEAANLQEIHMLEALVAQSSVKGGEAGVPLLIIIESKRDFHKQIYPGENTLSIVNGTGTYNAIDIPVDQLEVIRVRELNEEEVQILVDAVCRATLRLDTAFQIDHAARVTKDIIQKLDTFNHITKAAGIPYLIRVILQDLITLGILTHEKQEWDVDLGQLENYRFPERFSAIIQRLFETMSIDAKEILYHMTLLYPFGCSSKVLNAVYANAPHRYINGLRDLRARGLISEQQTENDILFTFTNAYYPEVIGDFIDMQESGDLGRQRRLFSLANAAINLDPFSELTAKLFSEVDPEAGALQFMKAAAYALLVLNNRKKCEELYDLGRKGMPEIEDLKVKDYVDPILDAAKLEQEVLVAYEEADRVVSVNLETRVNDTVQTYLTSIENYIMLENEHYDLLAIAGCTRIMLLYQRLGLKVPEAVEKTLGATVEAFKYHQQNAYVPQHSEKTVSIMRHFSEVAQQVAPKVLNGSSPNSVKGSVSAT